METEKVQKILGQLQVGIAEYIAAYESKDDWGVQSLYTKGLKEHINTLFGVAEHKVNKSD